MQGENRAFICIALTVLEVYAANLLKSESERPPNWRKIDFLNERFKVKVAFLKGFENVLKKLGYDEEILDENGALVGLKFPDTVKNPNFRMVPTVLTELCIANYEIETILNKSHPHLRTLLETMQIPPEYGQNNDSDSEDEIFEDAMDEPFAAIEPVQANINRSDVQFSGSNSFDNQNSTFMPSLYREDREDSVRSPNFVGPPTGRPQHAGLQSADKKWLFRESGYQQVGYEEKRPDNHIRKSDISQMYVDSNDLSPERQPGHYQWAHNEWLSSEQIGNSKLNQGPSLPLRQQDQHTQRPEPFHNTLDESSSLRRPGFEVYNHQEEQQKQTDASLSSASRPSESIRNWMPGIYSSHEETHKHQAFTITEHGTRVSSNYSEDRAPEVKPSVSPSFSTLPRNKQSILYKRPDLRNESLTAQEPQITFVDNHYGKPTGSYVHPDPLRDRQGYSFEPGNRSKHYELPGLYQQNDEMIDLRAAKYKSQRMHPQQVIPSPPIGTLFIYIYIYTCLYSIGNTPQE